jgi:hypothetical protein
VVLAALPAAALLLRGLPETAAPTRAARGTGAAARGAQPA